MPDGASRPRIAALKGARQFIFVTPHANVPVLASAEQVALIASDGKSAGVVLESRLGWQILPALKSVTGKGVEDSP